MISPLPKLWIRSVYDGRGDSHIQEHHHSRQCQQLKKARNKARGIGGMNFHCKLFAGEIKADLLLPTQENNANSAKGKNLT
jgi:hypothetical protein